MRGGGGADDREFGRRLLAVVGVGDDERARIGEFAAEQRDPRVLVQREVIGRDVCDLEHFGDDALMDRAVLAQVERREVEAEHIDRAN